MEFPQIRDVSEYPNFWKIVVGQPDFIVIVSAPIPPKGGRGTTVTMQIQSRVSPDNLNMDQGEQLEEALGKANRFARKIQSAGQMDTFFYCVGRRLYMRGEGRFGKVEGVREQEGIHGILVDGVAIPHWDLIPVVEMVDG